MKQRSPDLLAGPIIPILIAWQSAAIASTAIGVRFVPGGGFAALNIARRIPRGN